MPDPITTALLILVGLILVAELIMLRHIDDGPEDDDA